MRNERGTSQRDGLPASRGRLSGPGPWRDPGNHPRAGDIRDRDALLIWLAGLADLGFWLREHDVFANDEHLRALSEMGARRPGLDSETRVVSIFHFRDGRQIERWFFPEDAEAWDRILGGTVVVGRVAYSGR